MQHGTTPDYGSTRKQSSCSCLRRPEQSKRNSIASDCSGCKPIGTDSQNSQNSQEPFYLHPLLAGSRPLEAAHAPQDGLYINPMNSHRHSISSSSDISSNGSTNGESFYLHNPQEVIYNRVKDLFESQSNGRHSTTSQQMSALTGTLALLISSDTLEFMKHIFTNFYI